MFSNHNLAWNRQSARLSLAQQPTRIWGTPDRDAAYWRQQRSPAACAVVAQTSIYQSITGNYIPEKKACRIAQKKGWFDPQSGTPFRHIGKLLQWLNIPVKRSFNNKISDIQQALAQKDKVMVTLDSNEIWFPYRDRIGLPAEQPNAYHVVWVTGVENGTRFILNDSGTPSGRSESIDFLNFLNAWGDSNRMMIRVTTRDILPTLTARRYSAGFSSEPLAKPALRA